MGNVFISPNPKKVSVQIDINGNEVVPFTKEVLKKNEEPKISPEEVEKTIEATKNNINESILPGE